MSNLTPVKLLKHHDRYNAGEVAGFPAAVASHLIAQGVAKAYSEADEAAELAAAKTETDALAARVADLDAREAALAAREAAVTQAPAAGDPPVQGGKK